MTGRKPSDTPLAPVPAVVDRLAKRCLEEDPDDRWQSARDLAWELESLSLAAPPHAPARWRDWTYPTAMGILALALAALGWLHFRPSTPPPAAIHASILLPDHAQLRGLAAAPDGRQIAAVLVKDGKQQIWIRSLEASEFTPIAGTDGAASPFWSPDSRYIGFFADARLKKVDRSGGPVQTLCDALGGMGGTWNRHGDILFATDALGRVQRVSADGGAPSDVPHKPGTIRTYPYFLPDGRHYLAKGGRSTGPRDWGIWLGSIDSAESRQLLPDFSVAEFLESRSGKGAGQVLFTRNGALMALPFDARSLEPSRNSRALRPGRLAGVQSLDLKPGLGGVRIHPGLPPAVRLARPKRPESGHGRRCGCGGGAVARRWKAGGRSRWHPCARSASKREHPGDVWRCRPGPGLVSRWPRRRVWRRGGSTKNWPPARVSRN